MLTILKNFGKTFMVLCGTILQLIGLAFRTIGLVIETIEWVFRTVSAMCMNVSTWLTGKIGNTKTGKYEGEEINN